MRRDLALVLIFVGVISAPLLTLPFADGFAAIETRRPAAFPRLAFDRAALEAFPQGFQDWQRDHFGSRSHLIRWQSAAKLKLLGLSSSPEVVLGKGGFLFYRPELEAHLPDRALDPAALEAWRRFLESERELCRRRGARFLFLVAPDKSTLYPEAVPGFPARSSALDQLLVHLRARGSVELIDLRPRLRALRSQGLVYERTDTHWNERGGWAAAAQLEELAGLLPPRTSERLALEDGGDLARLLSLPALLREERPLLTGVAAGPPRLRLLFVHDSFGLRMLPSLRLAFADVESRVARQLDGLLLKRVRPDVVVIELVERDLVATPPEIAVEVPTP